MAELSIIYNNAADRRKEGLAFVGKERRSIILNAQRLEEQEAKTQAFLDKVQHIEDIEKLA